MQIRALIPSVAAALALAACASSDAGLRSEASAGTKRIEDGLSVQAEVRDGELHLEVDDDGRAYSGLVHTYLVAHDRSFLAFRYPDEVRRGVYTLDVPAMPEGTYDLFVEITGGNGHEHERSRFVETFPLAIEGQPTPEVDDETRRLALADSPPDIAPAGEQSWFELTTLLEGEPVAWGDPYVHQFIVGAEGDFFRHDHPLDTVALGVGSMRSSFTFPEPGEYVVFLFVESGLELDGRKIYPVVRHPSVFEVGAS